MSDKKLLLLEKDDGMEAFGADDVLRAGAVGARFRFSRAVRSADTACSLCNLQ